MTDETAPRRTARDEGSRAAPQVDCASEALAMFTHELRNALAPIVYQIQMLRRRARPDAPAPAWLDVIDRQAQQLERLIGDALDANGVHAGALRLVRKRLNYTDVVKASVRAVQPLMDGLHQRFWLALPEASVEVDGDDGRLAQALQNLLYNAAHHTPHDGEIALQVCADANEVVTTLSDTGRGITPEALERIFEPFVQERAETPTYQGLGLGLTLARRLTELHGGSLTAASDGLGHGSTFTLRLPRATDSHLTGRRLT